MLRKCRRSNSVATGTAIGAAGAAAPGTYVINEQDILGQIEGDTVELHLADAGAPTLLRQDDKSPALYVLMPMRV